MNDALLYGKSNVKGIVGIEINGPNVELFVQDQSGNVTSVIKPHKYWLLASEKINNSWVRLNGDLHYKFGWQTPDKKEWQKVRNANKWKNDIYSIYNEREASMVKDGYTFFQGLEPKDISILSFDIETVGLTLDNKSQVILISNTYRDSKGNITKLLFSYDEYESQEDMIDDWCAFVRHLNPSLLCGHNIYGYDFGYLDHCSRDGLHLGRDGSKLTFNQFESTFRVDGNMGIDFTNVSIYGRGVIDTYFLAQKWDFSKKLESYGLKVIIKQLGLEKDNRTFYDASKIRENYKNPIEMEKIRAYAEDDSDDSLKLWDHMGAAYFYSSNYIPKPFQDVLISATGSQINSILCRGYLQDFHSLPKKTDLTDIKVEGGISFGVPGIYTNILKLDIKSAYPSQILRFKIYDKEKDPKAYFYHIVKYFTEQRFEYKKKAKTTGQSKWVDMDAASKIFINSSYGCLNTPGLLFNSPTNAAKITEETRKVLNDALIWASGKDKTYWMSKCKPEETEQEC